MLTQAAEPGGGRVAVAMQPIHMRDNAIESGDCPVNLTMPQLPFQRFYFLVDHREHSRTHLTAAHNMIGDLLHRLDLHSDVEPIDDVRYRLGQCLWKPLHDLRAI